MSATPTPEQLRAVADELLKQDATMHGMSVELSKVFYEAFPGIGDPWSLAVLNVSWCAVEARQSVALSLRLAALKAEQKARRIPVGDANDSWADEDTCPCTMKAGSTHHEGCDWEICGKCQEQRIGCGCDEEEIIALVYTSWEAKT